jgi:hypothetical protein
MDLAELVHQLGPHGRAAVAEQLGANADYGDSTVTVISSSIYFAAASQAACDPVAVRRAEQFGVGGVFCRTEETPLVGDVC